MNESTDVDQLVEKLLTSRYASGSLDAIKELREIGSPKAIDAFIEVVRRFEGGWQGQPVPMAATEALIESGEMRGVAALLEYGVHPLFALKSLLGIDPKETGIRRITLGELTEIDQELLVEPLITALGNQDPEVRALAALALGGVPDDPRVADALKGALKDENYVFSQHSGVSIPILGLPSSGYKLCEVAALSLIRLGDENSIEDCIVALLTHHADQNPKGEMFKWMLSSGWEGIFDTLGALHEQDSDYVRVHAVKYLSILGDQGNDSRVIDPLIKFLSDKGSAIRNEVVNALAKFPQDERAITALRKAEQDKSMFVRRQAKKALKKIGK